jgi:predicted transposase YbfD/YdcC
MPKEVAPQSPHFFSLFDDLEDPRSRNCPHPLDELLFVAISAITSGAEDWVTVTKWARFKLDWLRRYLPFDNGIASHDTFSRVFALLDAQRFESCFIGWMQQLCPSLAGTLIPIDGKSVRGSQNGAVGLTHLVSAWHSEAGLVLGQVRTAVKSNEITAIPELLDALDVKGATITMDAMGCQHKIVEKIIAKQADYIVAVKNNQQLLAQAVESLFTNVDAGVREGRLQENITLDKDHGRLETRRCVVTQDLSGMGVLAQAWPGLKSVIMIESTREFINGREKERSKGKPSTEWRYYISSHSFDASEFNRKVRAHWSIENSCHWVLDVSFREDDCRIRTGDGAENFAILRRIAMNMIKREKSTKTSFNIKRLQAGWSTDYLETLFGLRAA